MIYCLKKFKLSFHLIFIPVICALYTHNRNVTLFFLLHIQVLVTPSIADIKTYFHFKNIQNNRNIFLSQHWNQNSVPRFAGCMQNVAQLLECPICLDTVRRPIFQCSNGHLLCSRCRNKTHQCPICRVSLDNNTARCLVAEKLLGLIVDTFMEKGRYLTKENICGNANRNQF